MSQLSTFVFYFYFLFLSQPNNNHNPNNKIIITVVGLRLSNCLEPPPQQTQNYMIEQKQSKTQKTKVISLYQETPNQLLYPKPAPKITHQGPKKSNMTPKLSQNPMSELKETLKIKAVHLHEQTQKQFLNHSPIPKIAKIECQI